MLKIFKKMFDIEYKELKRFNEIANKIIDLEVEYGELSDSELAGKTEIFKERIENGEELDDILIEAFATIREVAYRILGEKAYFSQLLGALAIHYGNIAEMKTGEGKTLTTIFPAYLNALTGDGVHVVTVNEYLTQRNAEWMGPVFKFLGLTVGVNLRELSPSEKQEVYKMDIMYTTNNELGFDYLRDNMVVKKENRVQRRLNYCIIDEVDSVLIDEARTPLIISGGVMKNVNLFDRADLFAKSLTENTDYIRDEKARSISLTDEGAHKCEKMFKVDNLYDINNTALVHHVNLALRANYFMRKDVDYVVSEGEIIIVDPFTGRLMKGRAYSEGLHQAIEAKEGVKINEETKTLATITFQNLFRMYKKLSGMTGTAKTEEEEFRNIYNMYVICIPTNKPVIRIDETDLLYPGKDAKYNAIVRVIEDRHNAGQPVLVGTIAIETSELISKMLTKKRIKHEVLNAKNHAREAEIIAHAGEIGAVTIATNMAGRGTDIKLGPGVKELGGLCVIGTERHESRRIDNQLRGRAGRQGDPGFSQFFVSFEDDLLIRFGSDRYKSMMESIGFTGDQAIRNSMFAKTVETAQKRVEGNNFDVRKHLLNYDDVMNNQRTIMYERRNEILDNETIHEQVLAGFHDYISNMVMSHLVENKQLEDKDYEEILEAVNENLLRRYRLKLSEINDKKEEDIIEFIYEKVLNEYEEKLQDIPEVIANEFEKAISLRVIDSHWMEHISTMSQLREGVGLRGYANENPLDAYTREGYQLFDMMQDKINSEISIYLLKSEIRQNTERQEVVKKVITNDGKETIKSSKKSDKIGRNETCPCGSGKKYKQCCGK